MIQEIREIPARAATCYRKNKHITLPENVPYLGMGSSYFAPLALKYLGCHILPDIASEYFHFLAPHRKNKLAVLLSQSGYSSETLWNTDTFESYIAIVNDTASPLAISPRANAVHALHAGSERYSSTKTYVNTLISLYQGLKIDSYQAVEHIKMNMNKYDEWGNKLADTIFDRYRNGDVNGFFIIGNGAEIATAMEAALILTETTKKPVIPMALPQFDHGPKEAVKNSLVLAIHTKGPAFERTKKLLSTLDGAGALTLSWEDDEIPAHLSPITSIIPLNFLAHYLAVKLGVTETFSIGNKVTTIG